MGAMKATLPDYPTGEYMYDTPPDIARYELAMKLAVIACGEYRSGEEEGYSKRLKECVKQISNLLKELSYDNGDLD
tara:strand:- start:301 stop:528 length:228 start_codon:yes stop_codon:yes gene_type:complete